jgi:hypothetical protein
MLPLSLNLDLIFSVQGLQMMWETNDWRHSHHAIGHRVVANDTDQQHYVILWKCRLCMLYVYIYIYTHNTIYLCFASHFLWERMWSICRFFRMCGISGLHEVKKKVIMVVKCRYFLDLKKYLIKSPINVMPKLTTVTWRYFRMHAWKCVIFVVIHGTNTHVNLVPRWRMMEI